MTKPSITDEVGWQLIKAHTTEQPQPSQHQLAIRFRVSRAAVQRYLAKNLTTTAQETGQLSKEAVRAELCVREFPKALAEVKAVTKDLTLTKMAKVLSECEMQYNSLKDTDPQIAGGYLAQMRQTLVEMAKWLGVEDLLKADKAAAQAAPLGPIDDDGIAQTLRILAGVGLVPTDPGKVHGPEEG